VDSLNRDQSLNMLNVWGEMEEEELEKLAEELQKRVAETAKKVKNGGPVPIREARPLPVRDDILLLFQHTTEQSLSEEWQRRAMGEESRRSEHWQNVRSCLHKECRQLTDLNLKLAEKELKEASQDWQAWLTQDEQPTADDPRAGSLAKTITRGLPMGPVAKAVSQALELARAQRCKAVPDPGGAKGKKGAASSEVADEEVAKIKASLEEARAELSKAKEELQEKDSAIKELERQIEEWDGEYGEEWDDDYEETEGEGGSRTPKKGRSKKSDGSKEKKETPPQPRCKCSVM